MLLPGTTAPAFTVPDHQGTPTSLEQYRGKWVILWWYPKALTPGCTACGQAFSHDILEFRAEGCQVLGVSFDPPALNHQFVRQFNNAFPLLSATREMGEAYEAVRSPDSDWQSLPLRISYLIDPEGVIRQAYQVGDPARHPQQVLRDLRALRGGSNMLPLVPA